ncbi:MAG TPA: L-threonylcarbamoyladenylate synthase [Janthinobacterium sp.]|jgi:L-threonylcarbamoyladenylate synthase|nr:L-threonylcarbamoyladenylate synthase [Janthinobacterium sp.]
MTGASTEELAQAAAILASGGLVAFPTETVYGLGADAENPAAVARIYAAKGRPSDHPVIVHVAPGADLAYWSGEIPAEAHQLAEAFWPGPLTLILKRAARIPAAVSGGQDTVGLRCPAHPVAIALLSLFKGGKGGVAAPSANKFGHVSPTTAQHVREEFGDEGEGGPLGAVLDGGQSQVGIESTIVDLSRLATHGPVLLRPGHISAEQIAAVIGRLPAAPDAAAPRVSGALDSHYAPQTPVAMLDGEQLAGALNQLLNAGRRVALIHYSDAMPPACASVQLTQAPDLYAHALYASLRTMDHVNADLILVETPPADAAWAGVNDRLRRAAFGSVSILERFLQDSN